MMETTKEKPMLLFMAIAFALVDVVAWLAWWSTDKIGCAP